MRALLTLALVASAVGLMPSAAVASDPSGGVAAPARLSVGGVSDPIGIDDLTPDLQWRNGAGVARQTAYQVRVASTRSRLGAADLWDSGRVRSAAMATSYAGDRLASRDKAVWQVRVWDAAGRASDWSRPASFEMGLLGESDWRGSWITDERWAAPLHQDVSIGAQEARYVRLTVIDLGRPGEPLDDPNWKPRLELGEIEVTNGTDGANLAEGATVTVSEENSEPGVWDPAYLTDGKVTTADDPRGYRSAYHPETDVQDQPIVITIDLGEPTAIDTLRLYSLWDAPSDYGTTPNFPRDFQVSVSTDDTTFTKAGPRTKVTAVSNLHTSPEGLPVLARDFTAGDDIASARLYVTGEGVYDASLNGEPVSPDLLQPGNTEHSVRVPYATYDVTRMLRKGGNTWGIELGNGIYNVFNTPEIPKRYMKAAAGHGAPRAMGQLEITYRDGRRQTVATGSSFKSTLGEVTFSNWYGGEDQDARRDLGAWNEPGADRDGWLDAVDIGAPAGDPELVAQQSPPIREVDALETVAVKEPKAGTYVFDLGTNFAGWQQLTTSGPAGTTITMRPAEKLKADGTVDQGSVGGDIRDRFTLAGTGEETFAPRFVYHGFRYLQVEGLTTAPTAETVTGLVLRANDRAVGSFTTSDPQMTGIHRIIDRSVQSNMYSVFTDCPHREKLGWLDQTNLVFDTLAYGYDVQAHYRKMLQDVVDAQQDNGLIPTTAPEDALFAGAFRHDANWGATLAVSSWQIYQWYGDDSAMRAHWPQMVEYADYLASISTGGIVSGGLGDWITPASPATPAALTQTWAYHRILTHMSQIAAALGREADAAAYERKAADVATAFHATFYHPETGLYGNGDQASQALALQENLVPTDLRTGVLDRFVQQIRAAGDHIVVGEVGLYAAVDLLSRERLDDVLHDWVQRDDGVSYGKFLAAGATSLPESWTSSGASQNHYMLGAIDSWFTGGVAGITQAEDSVAWKKVVIEPALVGDVESAASSYESVRGTISSSWVRTDGQVRLTATIPPNTTATVRVPAAEGARVTTPTGARRVTSTVPGFAEFEVGTGTYTFITR